MANSAATALAPEAVSLMLAMRRLWSDHVIWTRDYVMAALADSPEAQSAANRLLKNQEDIGNALGMLYGEAAGQALTDLLKQHVMIAVDLIDAAKAGDDAAFQANDRRWTENAEQIAALLSSANPESWPKDDVLDLLMQHLNLTKNEVVARLQGNWDADVAAFDDIYTEILTVSDVLSGGIVHQFPGMFGSQPAATVRPRTEARVVNPASLPTNPEAEKNIVFSTDMVGFKFGPKQGGEAQK